MKDTLLDIVKHTHALGFLNLVKIVSDDKESTIESMADDRSVIMKGKFHKPIGIDGTFGMPQLNKLDILLKVPEYKDGATITVSTRAKEGKDYPTGLHFENAGGDFKTKSNFLSLYTVIITGTGFPAKDFVFSLNALQNSIIFIPLWPRAGPTGGAGFA